MTCSASSVSPGLVGHLAALRSYCLLGRGDFFQSFFEEARGRAVQVDPIKPMLKAPGRARLKL